MAEPYVVLARKWRPQHFKEVVGQEHITRTLQNAIAQGRVGHAFLFIGSRGIGKTTTARILAKALNCEAVSAPTPDPCCKCENCRTIANGTSIDVVEIDGASNNSVEDVRQIRENIRLVPSRSRYKVYIIDEVHQLSAHAFNALLKTLEEPPPHAVLILATTEAQKVPATIISRCQRYDFRRVGYADIIELLSRILDSDGRGYDTNALHAIARAADGGIRDSETILEQVLSYCDGKVTFEAVQEVLGLVEWSTLHALCDAILAHDAGQVLHIVNEAAMAGKDIPQFIQEVLQYFRNLLVCKVGRAESLLALPPEEIAETQRRAEQFSLTGLMRIVEQLADLFKRDFDAQLAPRLAFEALLIRLCTVSVDVSLDSILEKLAALGAGGVSTGPPQSVGAAATPPPGPVDSAGPVSGAPAAAAEPASKPAGRPRKRTKKAASTSVEATQENLGALWARILDRAGAESLNLRLGLEGSEALDVDGGTLRVRLSGSSQHALAVRDKPEHRELLRNLLAEYTLNVRDVRFELADSAEPAPSPEEEAGQTQLPFAGTVRVEDARAALKHAHVAQVVHVFKGRIVDIRRVSPPLASPPATPGNGI